MMATRLSSISESNFRRLPILVSASVHATLLGWLMLQVPAPMVGVPDRSVEVVFRASDEPAPDPTPAAAALPDLLPEPAAPEQAIAPAPEPTPQPVEPAQALAPPAPAIMAPNATSSTTPTLAPPRPKPPTARTSRAAAPIAPLSSPPIPSASNARAAQAPSPPAAPAAASPAAAAPQTFATSDLGWRSALGAWLAAHKRYPERARQRGDEGTVGIRFTVDAGGRVLDVAVSSSSGSALLDDAARAMLAGQHVPPFPPSMILAQMVVPVSIRFKLDQ